MLDKDLFLTQANLLSLRMDGTHAKFIDAEQVSVEGSMFFRDGFVSDGGLRLYGSRIGGNLECGGGNFIGKNRLAIDAEHVTIGGHCFFGKGFYAEGEIRLLASTIKGGLILTDQNSAMKSKLDLRFANVGILRDEPISWPQEGDLSLTGFVYGYLDAGENDDIKSRINWLQRQPQKGFCTQPYEQLACVLRSCGWDEDAKKVLIAKAKDRVERGPKLTPGIWWWYKIIGPLIGYGYRPFRAIGWLMAFFVVGILLFGAGYLNGYMIETQKAEMIMSEVNDKAVVNEEYPEFNAIVYSLDVLIPIVNLYQVEYWLPNSQHGGLLVNHRWFTLHTGGFLRLFFWLEILAGWLFTSLLIVGLSGRIRT
jgi:hypothetical protein